MGRATAPADASSRSAGSTSPQLQALPTDPAALRPLLENTNVTLTARAGQLLSSAATPTAVKVALFEVLKGLPGATLAQGVKDPLGRTGVAIEFDDPAWHTLFLFNPDTGTLLGTRSIGHKELPGRDISDWSLTVDDRPDRHRADDRALTVRVA